MTRMKSFKRLVRSRMEKTGESYTAARAKLLAADEPAAADGPPLATSDTAIRERTGRGWEEWFNVLDTWGAGELTHRDIARRVAGELGIDPLAWNAQAITISYERARGMRAVGEHPDGFAITAQKTVDAPVDRLFDAWLDPALRASWLPGTALRDRTATRPRSARFDWAGGPGRVHVTFAAKRPDRSTVAVEHARLSDAEEAKRMKAFWREHLTALASQLDGSTR